MIEDFDDNGLMDKSIEETNSKTDIINTNDNNINTSQFDSQSDISSIEPIDIPNESNIEIVSPREYLKKKEKFSIVEIILILMAIGLLIVAMAYLVIYYITKIIPTLYDNDSFKKPYIDKKSYKVIKLRNGIEALLVSDRNSVTSAMSITLNVGSLNENPLMPGIATLAKRIMMLNTTKETNRTEFNNYLAKHFGRYESSVNDSMTSFYFNIGKDGFYHASVLFTNFIKYPLISEHDIRKEIDNIQSDYKIRYNDYYSLANVIEHKIVYGLDSYFPYGSNDTLNPLNILKIKDELEGYIKNNFVVDNIKVVLLGIKSIDELKGIAIKLFSDIFSKEAINAKPYRSQIYNIRKKDLNLGQLIYFNMNIMNELKLIFYFNRHSWPQSELYLKYLEYLLKDRKLQSLATVLKLQNYTNSFITSYEVISEHIVKFTMNCGLIYNSDNNNQLSIIKYIFNYLRIVRANENHEKIYNQMRVIFKKNFAFKSNPIDHLDFTKKLNENMFNYQSNLNKILYQKDYVPKYNATILNFYIDQLKAENCVIIYASSTSALEKQKEIFNLLPKDPSVFDVRQLIKEKYFGFQYVNNSIKEEMIRKLNEIKQFDDKLELRSDNRFITNLTNIKIINDDYSQSIVPQHVYKSNHVNLWHNYDISFQIPKIYAYYQIITQYLRSNDAESKFVLNIYYYYLKELIKEKLADAKDAGNDVVITKTENGYILELSCYSDLFIEINKEILPLIFDPKIKSQNFFDSLQKIVGDIENKSTQAYDKAELDFKEIMKNNVSYGFSPFDLKKYNNLVDNVRDFAINALYYGDINSTESTMFFNSIIVPNIDITSIQIEIKWELFSLQSINNYLNEHLLTNGSFAYITESKIRSYSAPVVMNYFKVGPYNEYTDAMTSLIQSIWADQFVNLIKLKIPKTTQAQSFKIVIDSTLYFVFTFQGNEDTNLINKEMDITIGEIYNKLFLSDNNEEIKDLYFDAVQNYLNVNEEKDFSLWQRSNRIFNAILQERTHYDKGFDYTRDEIKKHMTLNTGLKDFFYSIFYSDVKKLSIRMFDYDENRSYADFNETYALNESITTYCFTSKEKVQKMMKKMDK